MPTETGIFSEEETNDQYSFSYPLAKWIGRFLPKEEHVIDLGCGRGSYLAYLEDIGFKKLIGVEGEQQHSEIDYTKIKTHDLTQPFDLCVKGNVICLEVGEHIPADKSGDFFKNLQRHCSNKLILSWAIREQGGLGHINCLDNFVVIDLLRDYGFKLMVDYSVRARNIIDNNCSWFKHSIMVFERIG